MLLKNHYTGKEVEYRNLTIEEVKNLSGHVQFISLQGDVRRAKVNGKVRLWKRDPNRIEVPLKYGLRECATFTEREINRLVTEVNGNL